MTVQKHLQQYKQDQELSPRTTSTSCARTQRPAGAIAKEKLTYI